MLIHKLTITLGVVLLYVGVGFPQSKANKSTLPETSTADVSEAVNSPSPRLAVDAIPSAQLPLPKSEPANFILSQATAPAPSTPANSHPNTVRGTAAESLAPDNKLPTQDLVVLLQPTLKAATHTIAADNKFLIGCDDVLSIDVWKEPGITRTIPVRSDGKISLPLVGDIQASGRTPQQLQDELTDRLQQYLTEPEVTVIVQEIRSQRFNILGMVTKPGTYLLSNPTTVVDAIAAAGGFRDFAKKKKIYVLRRNSNGTETKLHFNYKEAINGNNPEQNIVLAPHDTLVVP